MTFTWYSYCNHVAVTWQSHDSHVTVLVHLTTSAIYARFSCGDQQWKCWPGVWPEWGTHRSAGKWLELLHLLIPFPPLIPFLHTLPPSHTHSTHSLPPTHTAHSRVWYYQHPGISTPSHWRAVSSLRQLSALHPGQWSSPSSRSRWILTAQQTSTQGTDKISCHTNPIAHMWECLVPCVHTINQPRSELNVRCTR